MRATQRPFCASPVEPLIWKRNLEKMCVVNLEKIHNFEHLQFRRCFWQSGSLPVPFFARLRFVFDWISKTVVAHVELFVSASSV